MFISKVRQRKGRRVYTYWVLKEGIWDAENRRISHRYICSLGKSRVLTESEARKIAEKASQKLGKTITVADLRRVKRLRIVPDKEPEGGVLTLREHRKRVG